MPALHLLSYNPVFIVLPVEGTLEIPTAQKTAHVILVQIYHTYITLVIFIINIITACVTVAHVPSLLV